MLFEKEEMAHVGCWFWLNVAGRARSGGIGVGSRWTLEVPELCSKAAPIRWTVAQLYLLSREEHSLMLANNNKDLLYVPTTRMDRLLFAPVC